MRRADPLSEVRDRVAAGERVLGMFTATTDPASVYMLGHAGFDFVILDNEHGPVDPTIGVQHVRAAEAAGILPIARVGENDRQVIQRFLDIGCQGILVPHVETVDDAERAVRAVRLSPDGDRGMCGIVPACAYDGAGWADFARRQAQETFLFVLVETLRGVGNAAAIAAVDGIDGMYAGPGDLSQEMGLFDGRAGAADLLEARRRVRDATKQAGKLFMSSPFPDKTPEAVGELYDGLGADMVVYGVDLGFMRARYDELARVKDA